MRSNPDGRNFLMTLLRRVSLQLLPMAGLLATFPAAGLAQNQPDGLWLTWNGQGVGQLVYGDCYDLYAGSSAAGITLDIEYRVNDGPLEYIWGWPTLDGSGMAANICTSSSTPGPDIEFVAIKNSQLSQWVPVGVGLTMLPQATGASLDSGFGFAGEGGYTMSVSGVSNTYVRVRYTLNDVYQEPGEVYVNYSGNYWTTLDHYVATGIYVIDGIQNAAAQDHNWTDVYLPYEAAPPQPNSFSLDKTQVTAGATNGDQIYHMLAGNGAEMAINFKYRYKPPGGSFGGEQTHTPLAWPWLYANPWYWSWNGRSGDIVANKCTVPGTYQFTGVQNSVNSWDWRTVSATLDVISTVGQPTITSVTPASANKGQAVTVTINGTNLCSVSFTPNYSGLTITNIAYPLLDGTRVTATFTVSSGAAVGNALVRLNAYGGYVDFPFGIGESGMPAPTISSVNPSTAGTGTALSVTMTGSNLVAPALSTAWSGLTFSNVQANGPGTSLTATFTISSGASTGAPTIQVTTPGGSVNTQLFSITSGGVLSLFWKKDYIQDDSGLVLATAVPKPADETAPGVPTGVGYSGLTSTSVTISWTGVGDSGGSGLGGYKVYRQRGSEASLPVGSVGPMSTSFVDPTLQPGTAYTVRLS